MSGALPPWQQRPWSQAMAALDAGRLPHALLLAGPAGLGKLAMAKRLAARLLCLSPEAGEGCGRCRSCELRLAGTHPDLIEVTFEPNDKGELRREILIGQIRKLAAKLVLTPHLAAGQVAVLHPAEAMNRNAFNALLKTLEEPPPGRHMLLVANRPQELPATIRSRCQWLRLDLPPADEALSWLAAAGFDPEPAAEALAAARGNPGLARGYLEQGGLALRRDVANELVGLARDQRMAADAALAWLEDQPALRLRLAGELVCDHLAARAGADRPDLLAGSGLAEGLDMAALADWFDASVRVAARLDGQLHAPMQLAELFTAWRGLIVA